MKPVLHRAESRFHAHNDWLDSYHTFSFANYFDPNRIHFGVLRVLNDDTFDGGQGFGLHPHANMEIITIPLEGSLEHQDNTGNIKIIKAGDVQVMSAGSGIEHAEINHNKDKAVRLLQIWVFPNKKDVKPRYQQVTFNPQARHNKFQQIVSPSPEDSNVWIHQDAWFHLGNLDSGFETTYNIKRKGNGLYAFVIEGDVTVNDQKLNKRDGLGLSENDEIRIKADTDAEVLLMDIPMGMG